METNESPACVKALAEVAVLRMLVEALASELDSDVLARLPQRFAEQCDRARSSVLAATGRSAAFNALQYAVALQYERLEGGGISAPGQLEFKRM